MDDQNQNNQFVTIDLIDVTNGNGTTAQVKLEQVEAGVQVSLDKINPIGDIRGVFFNVADNAALEGMTVTGDNVTSSSFAADSVNDLGGGVNVNPDLFDGGVEIGTEGIVTDDIQSTTFTLSNAAGDLTVDQFLSQDFGLRLTSVGENRSASSKLAGTAPATTEATEEVTEETTAETTAETTDDVTAEATAEVTEDATEAEIISAEIAEVEDSGIFDEDVYLEENPDVAQAVAAGETTAIEHFVKYGKYEFRQFSRIFSVEAYLEQNADVKAAVEAGETNAIAHYLQYGQFEKREFSYIFKSSYYLEQNADVAEAVESGVTSALEHFKKYGMKEGRKFNPLINTEEYLSLNADVKAAVEAGETSAIEHLFKYGCKEKRKFSRAFDVQEYLSLNPDVAEAVEAGLTTAFEHMFNYGFTELRKISKFLDLGFFAQANSSLLQSVFNVTEVAQIDATALVSYAIDQSFAQGLQTSESFNLSSAIASLSGFSSQQISSLFDVSSATEVSFGSLVEFFSNLFTSLETSFTSQQISSFFGVATVSEISFESLLEFVSTSFSTLISSSSSTSISLESLLEFISSSEGQEAIGGAMDDDADNANNADNADNANGDAELVLNIPLPSDSQPITPVSPEEPGDQPSEEPGDDASPIPAPTAFLDVQYIIKNNQDKLAEQFPEFDFANLTQEQVDAILKFAQDTRLNTSAFVNVSYFSTVIQTKVTSKLIAQGLTETEIAGLSQEELIKKGIELGFSPTPLIKLGWLKSANGKKLEALGIKIENNLELFEFITSKEGLELGLNLSPFFNPGFAKKIHKDKIREKFDIADGEEGVAQLEEAQVLDKIFSNGGIVIDIRFYKEVHIEALKAFAADLGVAVDDLTDEQITDFALNEGKEQGLALCPFKFDVLSETYSDKLKEFFGVEDVETLTEYELKQFIFRPAVEMGIDLTQVVDVQFYKTKFTAALTQYVGASFTDQDVINFVFGNGAPYVDEEYYKAQYGEEVTADGLLVKDLEGEELKAYIFTEGLEAGLTKLSAFDIAKYSTDHQDKLLAFFGVTDVAELSQGQVREFMVKEGWKFGINLSDYVSAEDIELYRTENAALLKELYGVEDVSTLSAELVLDAEFGGLTDGLDADFCLSGLVTKLGEAAVLSAFGVDSIAKVSYKQLVEYLYSQPTLEGVEISPFKVSEYVKANGQAIADALGIDLKEVAELKPDEIVEFMLGEGAALGISLEGFVASAYFETTYAAAIAASGKDVQTWLAEDYKTIDAGFVGYQFENLTAEEQTTILDALGITLAEGATLSTKQLIDIAYSAEFKEVLGVEEVKLSAIDIAGYVEANQQALIDYFAAPGIKIKSGSKKFKSGSLKFGKSGSLKPKSGSLKFGSSSIKLKGDRSMKLKAKSLKVQKSGNLKPDQIAPVDTFDVTKLTDKQVIEFMFDKGVELGINPIEFVEVDYLKAEFAVKIAERYGIDVTAVAELPDAIVVDAIYGGLSNDIDYEFVRAEYGADLTSKFGVAIEQVTDLQVLQYVYEVGVASEVNPSGIKITPVDVEGFVKANGEAIAQELGLKLEELPTFSYEDVFGFIFKQGADLGLNLKGFVNFDYFKAEFTQNIVFNYREENVFNIGADKVYEFINSPEGQGLSASPLYDPAWYRETYLVDLNVDLNGDGAIDEEEEQAEIVLDLNGDGKIDDVELKDFATGQGLDKGLETSKHYDFDKDFAEGAVAQDKLLAYAGVQSIEDVTFSQKLEYLTGQGLIDGYVFSGLQAIKDKPENQDPLLNKTGAASLDEITPVDLYQAATELQLFSV